MLVPCHRCGYEVPPVLESRCPECGGVWDAFCQQRQSNLDELPAQLGPVLWGHAVVWASLVLITALGAFVASGMSVGAMLGVGVGLGGGVAASGAMGLLAARSVPGHQRRAIQHAWLACLHRLHLPWLSIAGFTTLGVVLALPVRLLGQHALGNLMFLVILLEFFAWLGVCLYALGSWERRFRARLDSMTLVIPSGGYNMVRACALAVWVGSGVVGLVGGMLGAGFMLEIAMPSVDDWRAF